MNSTQFINFNGTSCVKLSAGGYEALVAYEIGSNVIRLRDNKNGIEFFLCQRVRIIPNLGGTADLRIVRPKQM